VVVVVAAVVEAAVAVVVDKTGVSHTVSNHFFVISLLYFLYRSKSTIGTKSRLLEIV
jgi:hypothetical protein